MNAQHLENNWTAFSSSLVERFADKMERRKDWQTTRNLEYKGDIQTYLDEEEEGGPGPPRM